MYLDLMDVLRSPGNSVQKPIEIAPTTLDGLEIVEPVKGIVRAVNARRSIVVTGAASTSIEMACARCLRPYSQPLELELEAVAPLSLFAAQIPNFVEDEDEGEELDDETAAIFDKHSVDVLELVRQAIELQAPLQPLCASDCAGLPEAAQYVAPDIDPRLSALQNWKTDSPQAPGSQPDGPQRTEG